MNTKQANAPKALETSASETVEIRPEIFQLDAHLDRLLGEVRSSH